MSMKLKAAGIALTVLFVATAFPLKAETVWTKGEVRKVDAAQSKITIKHEEITNLDMPPMTMVFFAPDATILKDLKPGQKAQFEFAQASGRLIVKAVKP